MVENNFQHNNTLFHFLGGGKRNAIFSFCQQDGAEVLSRRSKLRKGSMRNPVPGPAVQQAGTQVPVAHREQRALLPAAASSLLPRTCEGWRLLAKSRAEGQKGARQKKKTEGGNKPGMNKFSQTHPSRQNILPQIL